jgi:hypothetical protein
MTTTFIVDSNAGISGSLTQLVDGTSYLIAGANVSITSQSNGSVVISISSTTPVLTASIFTADGVFTAPVTGFYQLIGWGGGGGGGDNTNGYGAGGGGSLSAIVPVYLTANTEVSVSIGAGGSVGSSSPGVPGGTTTFGAYASFGGASGGGFVEEALIGPNTAVGGGLSVTQHGNNVYNILQLTGDTTSGYSTIAGNNAGFIGSPSCGGFTFGGGHTYGLDSPGFIAGGGGAGPGGTSGANSGAGGGASGDGYSGQLTVMWIG